MSRDLGLVLALVFVFASGLLAGVTAGVAYGAAVDAETLLAHAGGDAPDGPTLQPAVTCHVWHTEPADRIEYLCLETGDVNATIVTGDPPTEPDPVGGGVGPGIESRYQDPQP